MNAFPLKSYDKICSYLEEFLVMTVDKPAMLLISFDKSTGHCLFQKLKCKEC